MQKFDVIENHNSDCIEKSYLNDGDGLEYDESEESALLRDQSNKEHCKEIDKTIDKIDRTSTAYIVSCIFCMLMTAAQALSMVAAQLLDGIVPMFQLNMGGFGFALAFAIPAAIYYKPSYRIPWKTMPLLIMLSLTLYAQNITFFAATLYIPVGTNHSLNKFTSITVTLIIAHVIWKLRGELKIVDLLLDIAAAITMITGILLVIQPQLLFPNNIPVNTNITSYCNPDRLLTTERTCTILVNSLEAKNDTDCAKYITSGQEENVRPAWIGYAIGVISGFLAVSKVFLVQAIFKSVSIAQVMVVVPAVAFLLSSVTAISFEEFNAVKGIICITLLIFNFIGSMGAHVGFFFVMQNMPSTDYTIVSCLALVMLMIFQFTFLTSFVPTRTDPLAITGAVIISAIAVGKPIVHRWVSSYSSKK